MDGDVRCFWWCGCGGVVIRGFWLNDMDEGAVVEEAGRRDGERRYLNGPEGLNGVDE